MKHKIKTLKTVQTKALNGSTPSLSPSQSQAQFFKSFLLKTLL